jgi:hypothetical protein
LTLNYGITNIIYAAFDAAGNSASCNFTVNVTDPQPPTITCPTNQTVSTDAGVCYHIAAGGIFNPIVVDNCPIAPTGSVSGVTVNSGFATLNGIQFNKGLSTVTWSATDLGNVNVTCSFTVRVNDTEPPVVPADAGSVIACLSSATTPAVPSATDNCSGSINVELLSMVDNPASLTKVRAPTRTSIPMRLVMLLPTNGFTRTLWNIRTSQSPPITAARWPVSLRLYNQSLHL